MLISIAIAAFAQGLVPPPPPPLWCDPFTIFFDVGSATIPTRSRQTIDNIISVKDQLRSHMGVVGHADATGSHAFNRRLSELRADAVRKALIAGGVPSSQIAIDGAGESRLMIATEKAEAMNRRAEVCFY